MDEEGLKAARRYAGWEIGDASWANLLIEAYLNPQQANEKMDHRGIPKVTGTYR